MVNEGYTYQQIIDISGVVITAVSRWKKQYLDEMAGNTHEGKKALTIEQQEIQSLKNNYGEQKGIIKS